MENRGEIIMYQPDDEIRLEVRLEEDTVGRDIKTIGKHVNNALKEELATIPVVAKFATTASDGYVYENTNGYGYKPTNHYLSDITENMTIIRRTFIDKILLFSRDFHTQILCSSEHSKLYCGAPEIFLTSQNYLLKYSPSKS